jgi:hypothetical protein
MTGESFTLPPTPEAEKRLSPREQLEKTLAQEKAGSTKILAIADRTAQEKARHSKFSTTSPEKQNRYLMEEIAIGETIRRETFGVNAADYNDGLDLAKNISSNYYNEKHKSLKHTALSSDPEYYSKANVEAADELLKDLKEINNKKSREGK